MNDTPEKPSQQERSGNIKQFIDNERGEKNQKIRFPSSQKRIFIYLIFLKNYFHFLAFKVEGEINDFDEKYAESLENESKTYKTERPSASFHENRSNKVVFFVHLLEV